MTPSWPRLPRPLLLVSLALVVLAIAPAGASAATVSNTNDSGPGSLRQAIAAAAPGETIAVPAGTYSLATELKIEKSLTLAGAGAGATTIRAGAPNIRLLYVSGVGNVVSISGVTFRDVVNHTPTGIFEGGAILNQEAHLSLSGVVVTHNLVDVSGASGVNGGIAEGIGINSTGSKSALSISASTISDNIGEARGGSGKNGGIVEGAGISASGTLAIEGSTVSGNRLDASGGQGPSSAGQNGGIAEGGGVILLGASAGSVRRSTISGNSVLAASGPGATNGIAEGGGIEFLAGTGVFDLTASTVAGNSATVGAGGLAQGGGVVASVAAPASLAITGSTIASNSVATPANGGGGNLYWGAATTIADSIVSGGSGPAGKANCMSAGTPGKSLGFNLESANECAFTAPGDKVNTNPQLGSLAANGGPTATMLPALSSPAIDQGAGFGLAADQRGVIRPIDFPSIANAPGGNGADIGAVEAQPSNAIVLGKLVKNKKKGTATLTVFLPTPNVGTVSLSGKGLKPQSAAIAGTQPTLTLKVIPNGKAVKKALRKKGKRKIAISVTYQPLDNAALTQTRQAKLVKKLKKHHRAHHRSNRP